MACQSSGLCCNCNRFALAGMQHWSSHRDCKGLMAQSMLPQCTHAKIGLDLCTQLKQVTCFALASVSARALLASAAR